MVLEIYNPKPVPLDPDFNSPWTRKNLVNSLLTASEGMPLPVSVIEVMTKSP